MTLGPGAEARAAALVAWLRRMGSERDRQGMARYGIRIDRAFGVSVARLRELARPHRRDHALAQALWGTGWHEARLLATLVADPKQVTPREMEAWVKDLDSWDLCDGACANLWEQTPHALAKAFAWSKRKPEFVRRAGFVLMARLVHRKHGLADADVRRFLDAIEAGAGDGRNFVRKAVNWALRDIGKGRPTLRGEAVALARRLAQDEDASRRWVGRDALREFSRKGLVDQAAEVPAPRRRGR